ncbi:unnamed protein product [Closterium sp. NIES-53]
MYLMTCTRPDLAYPLSILARYVSPGRHRKEHMDAAKRVLRYLCSTLGMELVLGGRARVLLTGHADASWADDLTTQQSSQGYTFSLGSGSVSWRSTRSASVLCSICEAEIYAGAMAAQELRWLTYLLIDLGEPPRSPPVLTKHIAPRYFLARELQQRGQLRLSYVATRAYTAAVFTKALQPFGDQVLPNTRNLNLCHLPSKLWPRFCGPFLVEAQVTPVTFRLHLPTTWKLHNAFHVQLLKPYKDPNHQFQGRQLPPPPPVLIQDEAEYEVERVLTHRHCGGKTLEFLIRWKAYDPTEDSWVAAGDMGNARRALKDYLVKQGASCCFFRDCTIVAPLTAPVPVSLADPSKGPVVARASTVLPCSAAPSGSLAGLYLPSFTTNLVAASGPVAALSQVAASGPVTASGQLVVSCSSRVLTHQTQLWHHRLGHPSQQSLRSMHSRLLRPALHSSEFHPTTAPLQTLHMDVWGPACVCGMDQECYFVLVVDDYSCYTTVFPLRSKADVTGVLIPWISTAHHQLRKWFRQDHPVLRLHSVKGCEFSFGLFVEFCQDQGIRKTFTLPASPRHNGIAERRIGLVIEVTCTSIIHAAAPHFLWPFAVRYAAHQLNLWPRVSLPETSSTLCWTGEVGDASAFRVWGALSLVRDTTASKLSPCTLHCAFLGFPTEAPPWQFYHPTSRRVLSSHDVTFDESVYLPPLDEPVEISDSSGPAKGGDLAADDTAATHRSPRLETPPGFPPWPSSPPPQPADVDSGAAASGDTGARASGGADPGGADTGAETGGAETGGADSGGATSPSGGGAVGAPAGGPGRGHPGGGGYDVTASGAAGAGGAGGAAGAGGAGATITGGAGATIIGGASAAGAGGVGGAASAGGAGAGGIGGAKAACPGGARTRGAGAAGAGGAGGSGGAPRGARETGAAGPGGVGATSAGAAGAAGPGGARIRGAGAAGAGRAAGAGGATGAAGTGGAGAASAGGATRAAGTEGAGAAGAGGARGATGTSGAGSRGSGGTGVAEGLTPPHLCPPTNQSQPQLLPGSLLPTPTPRTEVIESLTECREPEIHASTPDSARHVACSRPPAVPGTHIMALRPSSVPQRAALPSPLASSLPDVLDPESYCHSSPLFRQSYFTQLVDFAARSRLDYVASLVTESESVCPPSVGGEPALSSDVLEDRQFELECLVSALLRFASMLLCPEGDPDALDIPTPRSFAEAVAGEYSSQWQTAMDAEMASWKSTGTYVDKGVDFFQTFSPTRKMTTLQVLLHVAAQRDYELHSLDFSIAFLQGSLHKEIWLCRPPGFTNSFPAGTQWSLRRPVYGLRQAPREWHDTLRMTLAALGFSPSSADPSLFLRTDTTLPSFYVLVCIDDLVFATADTEAQALVKAELQERHAALTWVLQRFGFQYSLPQPTPLRAHNMASRTLSAFLLATWLPVDTESCEAEIYAGAMAA